MGLLTTGTLQEDRQLFTTLLEGVLQDWNASVTQSRGILCQVTESGISTACKLASEHIFNGHLARAKPGPFKRAAAVAILSLYLPGFVILAKVSDDGTVEHLSGAQRDEWQARFAFNLIAPTLAQLETSVDGERRLNEVWSTPSAHFQVELIAWLKVLEAPFTSDGAGGLILDVARVTRAILALGLIVEACYYTFDPDLKGRGECGREAAEKHREDLEYDLPYGTICPPPEAPGEWHGDR